MSERLLARPSGLMSWRYNVFAGPERVGTVFPPIMTGAGAVLLGDVRFEVESPGLLSRSTLLTFQGVQVAASTSSGLFGSKHRVRIEPEIASTESEALDLRLVSALASSRVRVRRLRPSPIAPAPVSEAVGWIARARLFSRDAHIDLPASLPLAVRLYLFAIVLADWRRQSRSG